MMLQRLLVVSLGDVEISVLRILLMIVAVVAIIASLGQLVLMSTMKCIGPSQVTAIGIELPGPRLPTTPYSYWCPKEMERNCGPAAGCAL